MIKDRINQLPSEYRTAVLTAWQLAQGSYDLFRSELESAAWENPDLPVEQILEKFV